MYYPLLGTVPLSSFGLAGYGDSPYLKNKAGLTHSVNPASKFTVATLITSITKATGL